jgi:hypothetical protein
MRIMLSMTQRGMTTSTEQTPALDKHSGPAAGAAMHLRVQLMGTAPYTGYEPAATVLSTTPNIKHFAGMMR